MSVQTRSKMDQNITKPELISALALLLELNTDAQKDLNKCHKNTLEQMFISYKQNALRAQIYLEQTLESARKYESATGGSKVSTQSPRRVGKS